MRAQTLDSFDDVSAWSPIASGQAQLHLAADRGPRGNALRLDFDFAGGGGFVVARKLFELSLPESYALTFSLRGAGPANNFELKLVDPSGNNVWRYHQPALELPSEWQTFLVRSRDIEFAWGPAGGGPVSAVGAVEVALAAGPGGQGTLWIADLELEDRSFHAVPSITASSALAEHDAGCAVDGRVDSSWRSEPGAPAPWLCLDFEEEREYGGLIVQWEATALPRSWEVQSSNDAIAWKSECSTEHTPAGRSYCYLPDCSSRYLRLQLRPLDAAQGVGVVAIEVKPFEFSRSIHEFFHNVAASERRGTYPKYLNREQTYWTVVGVPQGVTRALLNEEGMLEVDEGTFSIEPFLHVDGNLVTWADAAVELSLAGDDLPIPMSLWRHHDLSLGITAFATGAGREAVVFVRYRIENGGDKPRSLRLLAALRPFQVTPPWQSFRELGGVSRIERLDWDGKSVRVNNRKSVVPLSPPTQFGAAAFGAGSTAYLEAGGFPEVTHVDDDFGFATAAFRYDLDLAAGAAHEIFLAIPFGEQAAPTFALPASGASELEAAVGQWRSQLDRCEIRLPDAERAAIDTLKTATAHILVNRDGPALQPGGRRYTRSWIRDGAIMAAALLRVGCDAEAHDFVRWYAPFQRADGFVPCCVDRSGADWLVEHDSHGQLIYAIMEYFRFSGDRDFVAEMWPAALSAVDCIAALRLERLSPEYQTPGKLARYGLLPESASHEGYLAQPVHSYWDDFWALRGLKDAAAMAEIVGEIAQCERITQLSEDLAQSLYASMRRVIAERHLTYIPGSVEWADFDPTATSNAIALVDEWSNLPAAELGATYDEYLKGFRDKHSGRVDWANYTPYEIRIIGALVRLGRRDDAEELLRFFLADRRPLAWNQWPEIAWHDPKSPGHLGDLPHTWIGAEYILSLRSMLVFERETDRALVIGAGVPLAWLEDGGVEVRGLPTWFGAIDLSMRRDASGVRIEVGGNLSTRKLVLRPPLAAPLRQVLVDGQPLPHFEPDEVTIERLPAVVTLT